MYPNDILPGVDLYTVMLCLGVMAAIFNFAYFSAKRGLSARYHNFILAVGAVSVILGYLSAVLFQAIYNAFEGGVFKIDTNTGTTFYGGFVGGVAVFFLCYFVGGHFVFCNNEHIACLPHATGINAAGVCLAHSVGRIGCLFAGCCYGRVTNSPISVYNAYLNNRVVPIQLFEALFLFFLYLFLSVRLKKGKNDCLQIYLVSYGIWRFFIEFFRDDDRGKTAFDLLTPSQLTAVILVIIGIVLFINAPKIKKICLSGGDNENHE